MTIFINKNIKTNTNVTSRSTAEELQEVLAQSCNASFSPTKDINSFKISIDPNVSIFDLFRGYNKFTGTLSLETSPEKQKIKISLNRRLNIAGWWMVLFVVPTYGISLIPLAFSMGNDSTKVQDIINQAIETVEFNYN